MSKKQEVISSNEDKAELNREKEAVKGGARRERN